MDGHTPGNQIGNWQQVWQLATSMATVLTDAQLPHVHEGVVVGRLLVEREQLGERAAHEVDEGPRAGAGELAVLDVGQVHRLRGALVHRGLVEPREPDEAEKREDPDPLVLVCAPPLDEQPCQLEPIV